MSFLHIKLHLALLFLVLTSVMSLYVMAYKSDSRRNCRNILCLAKEGIVTILLNKSKSAYKGLLSTFKKTDCEASLLNEEKTRELSTELCNVTPCEECSFLHDIPADSNKEKANRTMTDDAEGHYDSSQLKIGFKISLKSRNRSNVFILMRRYKQTEDCWVFDKCSANTEICVCSLQPDASAVNATSSSQSKPKLSDRGRHKRKAVNTYSAVFCFVLLCLIIELLLCVVLHLWLQKKCRRTSSVEVENVTGTQVSGTSTFSSSNPSYQLGPQLQPSSCSFSLHDTDQESYQPPYQPLVENTRALGANTGYLTPAVEPGVASRLVESDPAPYQDLLQNKLQDNGYQENLTRGAETGEPFYHVPEKTAPDEGAQSTSESLRQVMYHVVKELKSLNVNSPDMVSSDNSVEEPIYHVLEDPREIGEKNTQNEKS